MEIEVTTIVVADCGGEDGGQMMVVADDVLECS